MQGIFAISLVSMQQDMSRLDRVALNLANATTAGYKREVVAARPFVDVLDAEAMAQGVSMAEVWSDELAQQQGALQVLTDARPGSVKVTGSPFDVALSGEGYFEVTTDQGPAYTRQGSFHVDARGRLVTAQGYPVMGKGGDIYLTTQTPVIDVAGRITEPKATTGAAAAAPGTAVAQLKVVRFDDPKALQRLGDGLVAAGPGLAVADDGQVSIQQGALENSNVTSMQEMVELLQTMRHFESMQRVVQGYDEMIGSAIRKLGDLS